MGGDFGTGNSKTAASKHPPLILRLMIGLADDRDISATLLQLAEDVKLKASRSVLSLILADLPETPHRLLKGSGTLWARGPCSG